mmetsp:Transcript_28528/g.71594  ORF Transcript_28528/g.71594 Transcript_28528/m.71594 type:complete len:213 (+) Transcript_28528:935-1573(+)
MYCGGYPGCHPPLAETMSKPASTHARASTSTDKKCKNPGIRSIPPPADQSPPPSCIAARAVDLSSTHSPGHASPAASRAAWVSRTRVIRGQYPASLGMRFMCGEPAFMHSFPPGTSTSWMVRSEAASASPLRKCITSLTRTLLTPSGESSRSFAIGRSSGRRPDSVTTPETPIASTCFRCPGSQSTATTVTAPGEAVDSGLMISAAATEFRP